MIAHDYIYALALGIIQGITEFLPISSSAHLILYSYFVNGQPLPIVLNIALHMGTFLAVIFYFWRDWLAIIKSFSARFLRKEVTPQSDKLFAALIIGSIPVGIIGILWQDKIEAVFHRPGTTIIPLALVGILLWYGDLKARSNKTLASLSLKDAFLIGLAQACALIPGVSRSGITILCGRMLTYSRDAAARFSFLLGTPALAGAVLLNRDDILANLDEPVFYIGTFTAAVVGCITIAWLLRFLKRFGFAAFAIYRVALAAIIYFVTR